MKSYREMNAEELKTERKLLEQKLEQYKAMGLALDMTRGKPSPVQLDLTNHIYDSLAQDGFKTKEGLDTRNYSAPAGIPEMREVFAQILGTSADKIFLGNSSSLNQMFDSLMRALVFGEHDSDKPWGQIEGRKWLCPVPGYDRHFRVTQTLGFELVNVPMTENGPDMDIVEELVKDEKVMGIWCIPVYSNPDGIVYSGETCRRLASMKTAAKDFRIYWDNAYVVHHLCDDEAEQGRVPDILGLCEEYGNPSRVYEFASSSKITFAGAGISCLAANKDNLDQAKKIMAVQTICNNKVNQLAHARMLPDLDAVKAHMKKHAALLRPKFEKTLDILGSELEWTGTAHWHKPNGGYFVSIFVMPGTASRVVGMCKDLGVALTPAGATYPYGKDPDDSNIRIAPSFPSVDEIDTAVNVLCVCAKITAVDKLLEEQS
ncbi:DNA-binding transcriptional regulator, MocR family, contains an aminotransferase domain [Ruminococcaceae bacterium YRB3002]|nr:DNA-binding transcriptional regulator, MocR family, contains an aminotransferase domain [Ruminococcaceae bacterium YRB3002]